MLFLNLYLGHYIIMPIILHFKIKLNYNIMESLKVNSKSVIPDKPK